MPVIKDQELLYTLLSEGRLDLMFLPAGAIVWLWKDTRPEEQVVAATQLGVAAKDINPIVDASILKSDKNILILKCEDGQAFRVYPGGGYSHNGEEMMDLNGCIEAMQNIPEGQMQNPEPDMPCGGDMMDDTVTGALVDVVVAPDDGFDHMAAPMPPEEVLSGGPMSLEDLLQRATDIDMSEEYGDQPRYGQYHTYDELASETSRDIRAHSGEDLEDCDQNMEGQEFCNDGGLPHDHHYNDDIEPEDRYSVTSESFDFDLKKKS